jgi:hypothetical protein
VDLLRLVDAPTDAERAEGLNYTADEIFRKYCNH